MDCSSVDKATPFPETTYFWKHTKKKTCAFSSVQTIHLWDISLSSGGRGQGGERGRQQRAPYHARLLLARRESCTEDGRRARVRPAPSPDCASVPFITSPRRSPPPRRSEQGGLIEFKSRRDCRVSLKRETSVPGRPRLKRSPPASISAPLHVRLSGGIHRDRRPSRRLDPPRRVPRSSPTRRDPRFSGVRSDPPPPPRVEPPSPRLRGWDSVTVHRI